jgi:hypothetical protein
MQGLLSWPQKGGSTDQPHQMLAERGSSQVGLPKAEVAWVPSGPFLANLHLPSLLPQCQLFAHCPSAPSSLFHCCLASLAPVPSFYFLSWPSARLCDQGLLKETAEMDKDQDTVTPWLLQQGAPHSSRWVLELPGQRQARLVLHAEVHAWPLSAATSSPRSSESQPPAASPLSFLVASFSLSCQPQGGGFLQSSLLFFSCYSSPTYIPNSCSKCSLFKLLAVVSFSWPDPGWYDNTEEKRHNRDVYREVNFFTHLRMQVWLDAWSCTPARKVKVKKTQHQVLMGREQNFSTVARSTNKCKSWYYLWLSTSNSTLWHPPQVTSLCDIPPSDMRANI